MLNFRIGSFGLDLTSLTQTELNLPFLSINPHKLRRSLRFHGDDPHRDKQFNPTQRLLEKSTHSGFGIQKHLSRSQDSTKDLSRYSAHHPTFDNLSAIILIPQKSSEMIERPHNRDNRQGFSHLRVRESLAFSYR
jgi:hypothetical protein